MESGLHSPQPTPFRPRLEEVPYMVVSVSAGAVLEDIQRMKDKGVDIHAKEVTVEFAYGDNDVALADYRYTNGVYYLARAYDLGVHWPGEVREAASEGGPIHPPAPPEAPPGVPPAPASPPPSNEGVVNRGEIKNQYERLQAQIQSAQKKIEQAKLTGQEELIEDQQKRLEIGRRNLQRLLKDFPNLSDLPRSSDFPSVNLATAEGRERGRELVNESEIPAAEKGKRMVIMHKADAVVETRHSIRDLYTDKTVVRPPMRMALEDLRDSQRDVQHLNNQGLFAQFGNTETRHNNLLRLQSTRRTLELLLKRFPILPGVEPQEQKNLLGLMYSVIESSKKLEQGTQSNFLSRFLNQRALREESTKITRGLKQIDQCIASHPGFI